LTRRFTVKKEIRSLGIDLCNPACVIGAVVRGGLFLDGIVVFSPKPNQWNASIARGVIRTRFYPELKLIMTQDPEQRLDIRKIERMTRLPIIEVRASTGEIRLNGFRRFRVARKELYARSSLETRMVQEVLERSWTTGSLPESLRVAHLITKSRFSWEKTPVSG
jgi:endonuclease V-like protein UPF0215 family